MARMSRPGPGAAVEEAKVELENQPTPSEAKSGPQPEQKSGVAMTAGYESLIASLVAKGENPTSMIATMIKVFDSAGVPGAANIAKMAYARALGAGRTEKEKTDNLAKATESDVAKLAAEAVKATAEALKTTEVEAKKVLDNGAKVEVQVEQPKKGEAQPEIKSEGKVDEEAGKLAKPIEGKMTSALADREAKQAATGTDELSR